MKNCFVCGAPLSDNANFCQNCGARMTDQTISESNTNSISGVQFRRESSAVATFIGAKITINGKLAGQVATNEELYVRLPFGVYDIEIKVALNPSLHIQIILDAQHPTVFFPFKISASGKPSYLGEVYPNIRLLNGQARSNKSTGAGLIAGVILSVLALFFVAILFLDDDSDGNPGLDQRPTEIQSTQVFQPVVGTVENWEITINDFTYTDGISIGLLHEYASEEGSRYCVANITVKNKGKEADIFLPFIAIDGDTSVKIIWNDYEYLRSELLLSDDNLSSESLNPLVSVTGDIAFEVPEDMINSETAPAILFTSGYESFKCELIKQ